MERSYTESQLDWKQLLWKPEICHLCPGKMYYQMPFIWFEILSPHLPTVHNMKGCLMWNNLNVYINRTTLPTWHSHPGPVFLKRDVWLTKYDPLVDKVELIEANPFYAHIWHKDSSQSTVSFWDLAPITDPNNSTLA